MRRFCAVLLCALMLCSASCAKVYLDSPPRENWYQSPLLRLTVLDTDQSDCMLLQCGGEAMMVDGGTAAYGGSIFSYDNDLTVGGTAIIENGVASSGGGERGLLSSCGALASHCSGFS